MVIQPRGTHQAINETLLQVVGACPQIPYGLAVWAYDPDAGYVAPVSSLNLKTKMSDVDRFNDNFLRTKMPLHESAVGAFVQAANHGFSQQFETHKLSHHYIGQSGLVLQIVSDGAYPIVIYPSDIPTDLVDVANNIKGYQMVQRKSSSSVFRLKNAPRDVYVMASDVNGFTRYSPKTQVAIENAINIAATDIQNKYDVDIAQILGDQVRFMFKDEATARPVHDEFKDLLSAHLGRSLHVGSVTSFGRVKESFNGRYDDEDAHIHYKGDVFTKIAVALKKRPRGDSSFAFV